MRIIDILFYTERRTRSKIENNIVKLSFSLKIDSIEANLIIFKGKIKQIFNKN